LLKTAGLAAVGSLTASAGASQPTEPASDTIGCLVDLTTCIGCRRCEEACNLANGLPEPEVPFDHDSVFNEYRRPTPAAFTVVNRFDGFPSRDQEYREHTYAKIQCLHCLDPACVSACIVGALERQENGAVTYDADKCIGCRYCMVACPFEIPTYEFGKALTPRVRKCTYCFEQYSSRNEKPACVAACPTETLVFGKRRALLAVARRRINRRPDRYIDHIYGEHEAGGTAWLYLAGREFSEMGFLDLPDRPVPRLAESIQHATFKHFIPPVLLYGLLGGVAWAVRRRGEVGDSGNTTGDEA
jgi:Fe-S-cluster-containing dehydrogenase component